MQQIAKRSLRQEGRKPGKWLLTSCCCRWRCRYLQVYIHATAAAAAAAAATTDDAVAGESSNRNRSRLYHCCCWHAGLCTFCCRWRCSSRWNSRVALRHCCCSPICLIYCMNGRGRRAATRCTYSPVYLWVGISNVCVGGRGGGGASEGTPGLWSCT